MRRIVYSVAMSLDGFIAGPNGEYDWIVMDPDIDFAAIGARFDTLLMGRKSYQPMASQGGGGGPFAGMAIIVASRTLRPSDHPKATVVDALTDDFVRDLKARPGKDVWLFGGGELFRSLLEMGHVDRIETAVIPVLLGAGIPFLPPPARRASLNLTGHRLYPKSGIMMLEYAVRKGK